ncbi:MAG: hypothetical protein VSS75_031610, partial [Candidatus Parabeggiatoa sp.]|nr:hypothetical protein [Candidatus Parabeggiatoa sp.]
IAQQQSDMRWLTNYIGSEYDISASVDEAAGNFAHYYKLFREHSDNVHRFLRSGPLHSFLFCWLASKYQEHTEGQTQNDASNVMFQIGVEGQGKKRIIAESSAEWQETTHRIRDAISLDRLSPEQQKDINNPTLYEAGSEALGSNLIKALETRGNFTRRQLVQRCEDLFVETALLVGGAMGDILRQFNQRFDDYMVLYHAILLQKNGSPADFKQAMQCATLKAISPPQLDDITNRLFADLAGVKDCTAQPIKKAFLEIITEDTQGDYFKAYLDKQDEIDATSVKLRDTYRVRLMDVDAAGNDNASQIGIAGVAALHDIPDITAQCSEVRRQAQIKRLASQIKPDIPFQTTLRQGILSGEYQIVQQDTVIGTATVDDKIRENTLVMMSGQFEANEIDTVKEAEQLIAVSNADDAQRFTWKRTDYALVGKALNSQEKNEVVTFKDINLHSFEGAVPIAGSYQLQVDGDTVGEVTLTTETQNNTVPTIAGTLNTNDLDVIASDEKLTLKKGEQSFDWQAKERDDLLPIVRDYRGLKPRDVAGDELWQQQAVSEQQFDHFVGKSNQDDMMMRLHTLVLGEYMLAAPDGKVALDTADLSKMSGLIFDLVRRIGNPKVKALFTNKPSPELLNDPKSGLNAINLSQYYPVSDSAELNTVLQHHYAACKELLSMQDYVREIDQLRRTFDLLRHDKSIEIRLMNQTLEEDVNCTQSNNEVLLCNDDERDHHALFVYLTAQSDAQNGLESLKALLPGDIGVLSQTGWHTQLPLFVTTDKTVKSDAFPVISRESIALPDFSKLKGGIQGIPLLELCLSLMTTIDYGKFGEFLRKIHNDFVKLNKEVEAAGIPQKGQSISDYLKTLWFTHPTLRSNLIFLKWFNLGLQAKKQGNVAAALGTEFGDFLKNKNNYSQLNWDEAFEGLGEIEGQFPLKNFNIKLEPLYFENEWRKVSNSNNPLAIRTEFGFTIAQDNTGKPWQLVGIDWKNGYQDHI